MPRPRPRRQMARKRFRFTNFPVYHRGLWHPAASSRSALVSETYQHFTYQGTLSPLSQAELTQSTVLSYFDPHRNIWEKKGSTEATGDLLHAVADQEKGESRDAQAQAPRKLIYCSKVCAKSASSSSHAAPSLDPRPLLCRN